MHLIFHGKPCQTDHSFRVKALLRLKQKTNQLITSFVHIKESNQIY